MLTTQDHAELAKYTRALADSMELRDWTISVLGEPCDDDADGFISIIYGRKCARISFNRDFRSYELSRVRHVVAHELVHCHLEPPSSMVRKDLEEVLGKATDQVFWNGYRRQMEYAVDAIAEAIAKHLPLIDWPA